MNAHPLEELLQHSDLWRGRLGRTPEAGLATGFPVLDGLLPGGGWPAGAITEILCARRGFGELRLVMPVLARLSTQGRWIVWVAPPWVPYAPALAEHGLDLTRVLVVRSPDANAGLWAAEQALQTRACGAVLLWPTAVGTRALRRLQLAAERGGAWGVLFRGQSAAAQASPAALRLRLAPAPGGVQVEVFKRRGPFSGSMPGPVRVQFRLD